MVLLLMHSHSESSFLAISFSFKGLNLTATNIFSPGALDTWESDIVDCVECIDSSSLNDLISFVKDQMHLKRIQFN